MSDLRSLIEAAKADAPSAAARAKVWSGVSSTVGSAAVAGGSAVAGAAGAAKMLVLGTLLGGSLTVGMGAAVLLLRGQPSHAPATVAFATPAPATAEGNSLSVLVPPSVVRTGGRVARAGLALADGRAAMATDTGDSTSVDEPKAVRADATRAGGLAAVRMAATSPSVVGAAANATATAPGSGSTSRDDALAREASLLGQARAALLRSDALTALQIVRGLRALPSRQLVPEELAVEAQALRGLGLSDEAKALDTTLRSKYPDSVLDR
jgi:hypothetical protein